MPGATTAYTTAAFSASAPIAAGAAGDARTEFASRPLTVHSLRSAVRSHVKFPAMPSASSLRLVTFSPVVAAYAEYTLNLTTDAREWNWNVPFTSCWFAVPSTVTGAATTGMYDASNPPSAVFV